MDGTATPGDRAGPGRPVEGRAGRVVAAAEAGASDLAAPIDTVTLAYDDRYRRRIRLATDGGGSVLLDLPQAVVLGDGDRLVLDDGATVRVVAAPEPLVRVTGDLVRLAWHIGNRHLPCQIGLEALLIRRDPVIEAMLAGLGATLAPVEAPFDPERGAYAGGSAHGHGHHHAHDHG
ncbi:MAG: urease accessory protein UreE [Azospirillaceae bacterium]